MVIWNSWRNSGRSLRTNRLGDGGTIRSLFHYIDEKDKIRFQHLVGSHSKSWLEASREVNGEFFDTSENHVDREPPTMSESQCSLCGKMVKNALADHLETDCTAEL